MRTSTSGSTVEPPTSTLNALLKGSLRPWLGSETPGLSGYMVRGSETPARGHQGYSAGGVKGSCTSG